MLKEMDKESRRKRFERVKEKMGTGHISLFREKMEEAVKRGEVRELDPRHTFLSIMGACTQLFIAYPILTLSGSGGDEKKEKFIEEHKKHVIELIYNGLKTRKTTKDEDE
jgi:AcrR family transcriptional regulator